MKWVVFLFPLIPGLYAPIELTRLILGYGISEFPFMVNQFMLEMVLIWLGYAVLVFALVVLCSRIR